MNDHLIFTHVRYPLVKKLYNYMYVYSVFISVLIFILVIYVFMLVEPTKGVCYCTQCTAHCYYLRIASYEQKVLVKSYSVNFYEYCVS